MGIHNINLQCIDAPISIRFKKRQNLFKKLSVFCARIFIEDSLWYPSYFQFFSRFWNLLDFPIPLSLQTSSSSASSVNLSFFMSFHSRLINLFTFAVLAFFRQRKVNFHFSSDCVCVTPSNMRSITIIGFLRS